MIRAPYFRAIAGPGYPLAPRNSGRRPATSSTSSASLVVWVLPFAGVLGGTSNSCRLVVLVIAIIIVFADYVIVFEDVGFVTPAQEPPPPRPALGPRGGTSSSCSWCTSACTNSTASTTTSDYGTHRASS